MKTLWDFNKQVDVSVLKKLGNTYTHPYISKNIIDIFTPTPKSKSILEPSIGSGSFYYNLDGYDSLDGYDIDKRGMEKIEINSKTTLHHEDYLLNQSNKKYDLVITNPPYISYNNISGEHVDLDKLDYIKKIQANLDYNDLGLNPQEIDMRSDIYLYFFLKGLNQLSDDGKLIFLCSDKWLDTKYGKPLRKILTKNFKLESLTTSNFYPFFRDETNAIVTVISRRNNTNTNDKIKLYSIEDTDFTLPTPNIMTEQELRNLFLNEQINRKNKLLFHFNEYIKFQNINAELKTTKLKNIVEIKTSNLGYNILKDKLISSDSTDGLLFFYQKQARVNAPACYKSSFTIQDIPYKIKQEDIKNNKLKNNNMYLGSVIDKFPLCFIIDEPTMQSSKYYSFEPIVGVDISQEMLVILTNNLLTIMNIEATMKNATKRSARRNENGVLKEINKHTLLDLEVFDISLLDDTQIQKLISIYELYKNDQIFTLEQALDNIYYMELQRLLFGYFNAPLDEVIKNAKDMYYKRLKNLKYLGLPLEYPES